MSKLQGSFVALITPFNRKGRIDTKTLEHLIEWHIKAGTDGIVCIATTGEGVSLSDSEKKKVIEICAKSANGRVAVIAATGASGTAQTVRYSEIALKLGADGCLVVTPFYNRPTQRGIVAHFQEVAKVGLPIIAYHNPARAAVKLTFETVVEMAPSLAALKDSSHDLEFIGKICKVLPVFAGDDDVTVSVMKMGGVGCIGVVPNVVPGGWKKMITLAMDGKWDRAEKMMAQYMPLIKAIFTETNPQGPKFALSLLGGCLASLRLPMVLPTEENQEKIRLELIRLALPYFSTVLKEAPEFD